LIYAIFACIGGIGFAFYKGPMFALACFAYVPVFLTIIGVFGLMIKKATIEKIDIVKGLGGIAEETLNAIKVVVSFGREEKEI
jgi:ABC-type multidrug transport system fused ATPase/permease subunit